MRNKVFEGEATARFRVFPVQIDNLLFSFCILGSEVIEWADQIAVKGTDNPHYWQEVSKGATMVIHDKFSDCMNYLDTEKLMQGIRRWIENGEGSIKNGKIEVEHDETVADRIVQYALFEEVRYE